MVATPNVTKLQTSNLQPGFCLQDKRVAMVTFSHYPADPRPRRVAEALLKRGMSIDLICLGDETEPAHEIQDQIDIRRLPIPHRRGGPLSYACHYSSFIIISACVLSLRSLKRRYDLVYVHNMPDILVVSALVPKALGAKVVLDMHDPMPELMTTIFNRGNSSFSVRLIRWLERWSIARANFVITVNAACERLFAARSCHPDKISVVMNAPDDQIFWFHPPRAHESGDAASTKRFVIMYHGSIVERNGLDLAIDALARVRKAIPFAQLRIYGRETPFLKRAIAEARSKGLDDCVRYLGPKSLEQLVPEIEACDLGIVPNHHNAFAEINTPTRIFEYLALGKPVIAPRAQGICDYFDDRSLLLFELGNADDLARKIEYVWSRPEEVFEIVQRGQKIYQEHDWQTERERLLGLVAGLLCGERDRPETKLQGRAVKRRERAAL